MTRLLIYSFTLVLLYPVGTDVYLVGLPRIAADLQASEARPHVAFPIYLTGMATVILSAGKITDQPGRKPVAIVGASILTFASALCSFTENSTPSLIGRSIQGIGAGCCYTVTFAILRGTLDDHRRVRILSLLSGVTCTVSALAPMMEHLIMLKFPWQNLFCTMMGMSVAVCLLSVFIPREPHPATFTATTKKNHTTESLVDRFFLSRLATTILSVSVILIFVNASPVLLTEVIGFDRGEYVTTMAMTVGINMAVSFSTPFALSIFKSRVPMLTSQVLSLHVGVVLILAILHTVTPFGLTLVCAGFSVGFGIAMSQALGSFSLYAGVTSSALGITQACGSSLRIWLTAVPGLDVLNTLIGILIGYSIVGTMLIITVVPNRSALAHEEIPQQSRS